MLSMSERGSSLVEVLIASAIGALVVLAMQQQLQWQTAIKYQKVPRANFLMGAQNTANQFLERLKETQIADISNPQSACYLFTQHRGGSVGFRVKDKQLQYNPMTLDCAGYGWQSLTNKSQFKVAQLSAEPYMPESATALAKLFVTLTVSKDEHTTILKRLITIAPG
ncbi:prepilin-type N-terminal cleavage/methylation domain-containing protein [Idiomarina aminovorans]|uniref:prepilin-type N-terminal cleavage/methylation domain-containing protein n=1 Tax=Idiomarina aminovorans TaxID=2914829 RepID=UPI0020045FF0|nr:prepilin-type N-terminal cleavage/methylation domain-containing protein [Idiomarina sp. ATCH4]MCK7458067.1 prepilin peptidase dependent protein B-like protein [Idiomarina sp. ATCH4]